MSDLRGEVWSLIRGELGRRYPDASDEEVIRNDANASTIADAILAAIGSLDATGGRDPETGWSYRIFAERECL